jgi:probable phosphoglycerate mutase
MSGMEEMRILLARHGHATSGPDHRWTRDDPLTDTGLAQAEELAAHLAGLRRRPDRIIASPAVRARQTAAACGRALGLPVTEDERLIEFGSGTISPFTLTEMFEQMPYDEVWHPQDPGYDGEPVGDFWTRTAAAIEDVIAAGGAPLVVSHGGTTTAILRHLILVDRGAPDAIHFYVSNAGLSDLRVRLDRFGNRRVMVARLNDTGYLSQVTEV